MGLKSECKQTLVKFCTDCVSHDIGKSVLTSCHMTPPQRQHCIERLAPLDFPFHMHSCNQADNWVIGYTNFLFREQSDSCHLVIRWAAFFSDASVNVHLYNYIHVYIISLTLHIAEIA